MLYGVKTSKKLFVYKNRQDAEQCLADKIICKITLPKNFKGNVAWDVEIEGVEQDVRIVKKK